MEKNDKIVELKWIFVDQISDLVIASLSIRERIEIISRRLESNSNTVLTENDDAYFRMCATFLILTLAKLEEALKCYANVIKDFPPQLREKCTDLRKCITDKGIRGFRNTYAAHVQDEKTKKILSASEGELMFNKIIGNNIGDYFIFSNWIYTETSKDISVVSTITEARDHCLSLVGSEVRK